MRLISWNVNGIRAGIKNGFYDFLKSSDADVVCLQETKADEETFNKVVDVVEVENYEVYSFSAQKKGYSGTAVLTKIKPLSVIKGTNSEFDNEGRVLTLEFDDFYLVNAYFVNSQRGLLRLKGKEDFNEDFLRFCEKLRERKPLVMCGDFNVAHKEIDLANPKSNERNAGFTIEERDYFTRLLDNGYIDTFREFEKNGEHYTWWSYMFSARAKNIGWRIDYFLVSSELKQNLEDSIILNEVMGSDHCPVELKLKF